MLATVLHRTHGYTGEMILGDGTALEFVNGQAGPTTITFADAQSLTVMGFAVVTTDTPSTGYDLFTDQLVAPVVASAASNTSAALANSATLKAAFGLTVVAPVSASGALAAGKHTPVDATAAARTMTLPTGASGATLLAVEKTDASTNAVTITGNMRGVASQNIDLLTAHEVRVFVADSTGSWWPAADHRTKKSLDDVYSTRDLTQRLHSPTQEVATFQQVTGSLTFPGWLSPDGKRLYSYNEPTLHDSTDGGATWRTLHAFTSTHFVLGVREMPNGELLVSTSLDSGSGTGGEMWVSAGYNFGAGGAAATWTKTLTMDVGANAQNWYSFSPPLHHHDDLPAGINMGIMAVGEYGTKATPNTSRKVYASQDYGQTWAIIYDPGSSVVGYHHHGVAYDPWGDAMWITTGDGAANYSIRYSTDWRNATPTWTSIPITVEQSTTIWPLPDCVLIASDANPNGVHRVERTKAGGGNYGPILQTPFRLNTTLSQTHDGRTVYKRPGGPVIFAFSTSAVAYGFIIATWNGRDFYQLWTEPVPYTDATRPLGDYGAYTALGPTVQGTIVGHMRRDNNGISPTGLIEQFYTMPQPKWERSKADPPPYPTHVQVPVFSTPVASSLWTAPPSQNSAHYYAMSMQASLQNSLLTWEVLLGRGVYTIDVLVSRGDATCGKIHILIDGVDVGSVDGYAASPTIPLGRRQITGVTVGNSGLKQITATVTDKNASSTGYGVYLSGISFTKTLEVG